MANTDVRRAKRDRRARKSAVRSPDSYRSVDEAVAAFATSAPRRAVIVARHWPQESLWMLNGDDAHPAASLLKVPLAAAALAAAGRGEIDLQQRVDCGALRPSLYPSPVAALGEALTLRQLCALAIATSDNTAASTVLAALPEGAYAAWLQGARCEATDTPPGFGDDDLAALARCATTARDQLRILEEIWAHHQYGPLRHWMVNNVRNSRLSARLEPPVSFAHKTATLGGAAHDVGVLDAPTATATIVVLTSENTDSVATSMAMADLGRALVGLLGDCSAQQHTRAGYPNRNSPHRRRWRCRRVR